jgi:hypothetical protein
VRGSYVVGSGEQERVDYALNSGPVEVVSTNEKPIIAALLDAWAVSGVTTSYGQLMGLAEEQLSNTYYFPAYNNKTLYAQLRFANVGDADTTVRVEIGGVERGSYVLGPNEQKRVDYALDSGPVVVRSDGEPIVAALLDAWRVNGVTTSYSQMMGLPAERLSDTYVFPAYNNKTLYGQLRFGNVGVVDTTVTVTIGGVERGSYVLGPSEQKRVDYALDSGPVVVSSGVGGEPIIAALLDAWQLKAPLSLPKTGGGFIQLNPGTTTSYVQMMGMPVTPLQPLSDTYYFPSYNNKTLYAQLRFGVP